MKSLPVLVASTLLAGAAPPPDAQTKEDVRCLIAAASLAASDDPKAKQAGTGGALYYLGRLDGRTPGLDIEAAVAAEVDVMAKSPAGPILMECGNRLKERGHYLESVGRALEKRGK